MRAGVREFRIMKDNSGSDRIIVSVSKIAKVDGKDNNDLASTLENVKRLTSVLGMTSEEPDPVYSRYICCC